MFFIKNVANMCDIGFIETGVRSKTLREMHFIAEIRLDINQKGYKVGIAVSQLIAATKQIAVM
jgi:hypothetical protein